jgi:hypothetical protein
MAIGDDDPVELAKRKRAASGRSNFPAANQFSRNTAFARNAPVNTPAQNALASLSQIPVGGFGLGALSQAGYSRAPQFNLDNFLNQGSGGQGMTSQQPTLSAYHWRAGSGGVQGGNDAYANATWSNGVNENVIGGVNDFQLGMSKTVPQPAYPQAPDQYPAAGGNVNFNVPGGSMADALNKTVPNGVDYNAGTGQYLPASTPGYMSATKGSSQFTSAPRTTNQFGQTMINSLNGGQITTDKRQKPWLGGY